MGQHKFEKDLKNKLNAREITPSEKAWDRLDAMLALAEDKKPKRNYGWLYMAASIVGLLFIGTVFFSQTESLIDQGRDNVVLENAMQEDTEKAHQMLPVAADSEQIASSEPKIKTNSKYNHQSKTINQNQSKSTINPVEAVNQIPENEKSIASAIQSSNQSIASENIGNSQKPGAVKVDELLAAAQNQQVKPKTSVKVNAKSLLSEVDHQVNLSFREKMLRRAGEVAETVANRNNE